MDQNGTVTLAALRRLREMTQVQLGAAMGKPQNVVSRFERQGDVLLSTLAAYVEATGGVLRLVASYPDAECDLTLCAPGA